MNFLRDGNVLVLGLGESGLAMVRWCVRQGATVRVWDSREAPPHAGALRAELPQVMLFSGELGAALPEGVNLVLKSPGLAPHDARIAPLLATARATGVAVLAELDLFMRALADLKEQTAREAHEAQAARAAHRIEHGADGPRLLAHHVLELHFQAAVFAQQVGQVAVQKAVVPDALEQGVHEEPGIFDIAHIVAGHEDFGQVLFIAGV